MKRVEVGFYALLREQAGTDSVQAETEAGTVDQLFHEMKERYSFSLDRDQVRVAVNDDFVSGDHAFSDGDRVVFLPPVAGG